MLVEGSVPKPLKTRASALWLCGYVKAFVFAGFSIIFYMMHDTIKMAAGQQRTAITRP